METAAEPTNKDLLLIELEDKLDGITEQLHFCHREWQGDKHRRLSDERDSLIKRIDRLKAQQ